ncbi:DUF418 domain-containing protein [Nocardia sp. XZ_19_385]|uniref:DUF418 domain-containing protein n=1 Tax=Nocardia sp. XZ_19_385 TaxID=2769488 RepID=UPI00188DD15D|nr:DUF418 domain-containing protein [Nocardia sp. XZ_19_385]
MAGDHDGWARVPELDAVRGFAVGGAVIAQTWRVTGVPATVAPGVLDPMRQLLAVVAEGCFLPIFAVLFGVSFSMVADRATARAEQPWLVLLRRVVALGVLGLVHQLFQPGEALLPYALAGLVILLPAAGLPRWVVLAAGLAATAGAAVLLGDGFGLVPGLFLLGMAGARFRIVEVLRERAWLVAMVFALALPAAVLAGKWEFRTSYLDLASSAPAVAGLLGALAYTTGLLLLLRTSFGELLGAVLRPMGRMALSNYLGATVLILVADALLDSNSYGALLLLAVAIILLQTVFSALWLRWLRFGPVEWLWRCVTWWEWAPIWQRRPQPASLGLPHLG